MHCNRVRTCSKLHASTNASPKYAKALEMQLNGALTLTTYYVHALLCINPINQSPTNQTTNHQILNHRIMTPMDTNTHNACTTRTPKDISLLSEKLTKPSMRTRGPLGLQLSGR